jgi:hypothetical protein
MSQAGGQVFDDLDQAVEELEAGPSFPAAYAARVREALRRLDPFPPTPLGVPQALALVTHQARIDVDVPLRTRRRGAKAAKIAIKRATAWYLRYLADQVGDLGQALVYLGVALADRVEAVQAQLGETRVATEAEIELLRARIAALEAAAAATPSKPTPSKPGQPDD